jgi:hypothetical protein
MRGQQLPSPLEYLPTSLRPNSRNPSSRTSRVSGSQRSESVGWTPPPAELSSTDPPSGANWCPALPRTCSLSHRLQRSLHDRLRSSLSFGPLSAPATPTLAPTAKCLCCDCLTYLQDSVANISGNLAHTYSAHAAFSAFIDAPQIAYQPLVPVATRQLPF